MTDLDISTYENKLTVRQIRDEDIDEIIKMAQLGFENPEIAFERKHYKSHLDIFPEGQFCIEYNGKIVGSCSSLIINFDEYGETHALDDICDEGFIRNHNPDGVNLYGIDVVVHPDYRHMKIGRRLYEVRRKICQIYNLKSILFGGRIPNYHKYANQMSAEEYAEHVLKKNIYDPVLTFQVMNGFKLRGVMPNYLVEDHASMKYATLMEWQNPDYMPRSDDIYKSSKPVRLSAVQYMFKEIRSFDEFAAQCEYFIDASSKIRSDFVVFPEALTMQLLSFLDEKVPSKQVRRLVDFTEEYGKLFSKLAIRYNINIIAGTHFAEEEDALYNVAYLFRRDGTIGKQYKLHIPTDERKWWGTQPGNKVQIFDTDCGKIAILIGYDIQFPELARTAVENGAEIIFTPFSTSDQQSYLRLRYCSQARAVENQAFIIISGMAGHLNQVHHMNMQYAQSGIYSPSDYTFPSKGIVGECDANIETVVVGEVDLEALRRNREVGTVTPLKDRRRDIYTEQPLKI